MTVLCRIRLQIPWWYDRPMWCLFRRCLCTYCLLVESIRITIYPNQLYNPNKSRRECLQHMCETSPFLCKRDLASCAWRCSAISYCWQWHDQIDGYVMCPWKIEDHLTFPTTDLLLTLVWVLSKTYCAGTDWGSMDTRYIWMIMHGLKRLPCVTLMAGNQKVDHVRG